MSVHHRPDGRRVVTAGHDRTARVWDAETGQALLVLQHPAEARHAKGSARLLQLSLRRCTVHIGEAFDDAELQACRLMVAQAAAAIDAGHDAQLSAAQAKLLATQMAERQLPALAQAMGAEGLRAGHPFGRHLLGARVAAFVDGSSEMLLERIAAVRRASTRRSQRST